MLEYSNKQNDFPYEIVNSNEERPQQMRLSYETTCSIWFMLLFANYENYSSYWKQTEPIFKKWFHLKKIQAMRYLFLTRTQMEVSQCNSNIKGNHYTLIKIQDSLMLVCKEVKKKELK
jgi:hypothetical protein